MSFLTVNASVVSGVLKRISMTSLIIINTVCLPAYGGLARPHTAEPFLQIAKEIKLPAERLKRALLSGLDVTALDALLVWHQQLQPRCRV
jgi:hypothetical protein